MKKSLAVMFLLMLSVALNAGQIVPKLSLDNHTSGKISGSPVYSNFDTDLAVSVGIEYLHSLNENIAVGGGAEYQFFREIKKLDGNIAPYTAKFNYMPIYATAEYLISMNNANMKPFAKVNLGYAFYNLSGDADWLRWATNGGMYFAVGGGINVKNIVKIELKYSIFTGSRSMPGAANDDKYAIISLGVGYIFDI